MFERDGDKPMTAGAAEDRRWLIFLAGLDLILLDSANPAFRTNLLPVGALAAGVLAY
jgi:hypothetical protein